MNKRDVVLSTVMFVGMVFAFLSCEKSTSTDLEKSLQFINEVTPIPGAQNVTMNLQEGDSEDSYFTVSLNDGATREAWCIEWNESSIKGIQEGAKLYSTKAHEEWRELNYFMSIKNDLMFEDPTLTYKEIQVIIWSLIKKPVFDVDKIAEYQNVSERIYKDGEALFDKQKVKDIVKRVKNDLASRAKGEAKEEPGVVIIENDGQAIMVASETAFAVKTNGSGGAKVVDTNYSTCFDQEIIEDVSFSRWGWTNGKISDPSGELIFDIYAGAGRCDLTKGTYVGQLTVNYSGGTFTATYQMTETSEITGNLYKISETHLYIGAAPYPQKNSGYTVAPGKYGNTDYHDNVTEYTYEITGLTGDIYFIAHAVVNGFDPDA